MEWDNKHLEIGILVHSNRKNMEIRCPDNPRICNL